MSLSFDLEPRSAWLLCFSWSMCYVLSLYLVPSHIRSMNRENPIQIRARALCVTLASAVIVLTASLKSQALADAPPLSAWLGLAGPAGRQFRAVWHGLLLTACLFLGPLVTEGLMVWTQMRCEVDVLGRARKRDQPVSLVTALLLEARHRGQAEGPWPAVRNLLVGPVTEELVFRGCFLPVLLCSRVGVTTAILLGPVIFGTAHFHHVYGRMRQGLGFIAAAAPVVVQLAYTSVFGAYASFLHLRTGHLLAPIACHTFCNIMGLPDLSFRVPAGARHSGPSSVLHQFRRGIWSSYALGIVLFAVLLMPLTDPVRLQSVLWYLSPSQHAAPI